MKENVVVTKEKLVPQDWHEDAEIILQHGINGHGAIFRRIYYENGYAKRFVIGFTPEERKLASVAPEMLKALKKAESLLTHLDVRGDCIKAVRDAITKATQP